MFNKSDTSTLETTAAFGKEGVSSTPELRRAAVASAADFMVERAVGAMYPDIVIPAEFAMNGYPENAEDVARTSSAAAHQAIQNTIADQRQEYN